MAEILLNTNSPVKHKVFWRGEVREADDLPTVKVYDIYHDDPVLPDHEPYQQEDVVYETEATRCETDIGVYEVYLPYALTKRPRTFLFVWTYEVEGELFTKEHKIFVVKPYVDLAQAIYSLGLGADPSDPNYKNWEEVAAAERYARKVIENHTGQEFYLYNDLHTVYGSGSDILPLPYKLYELHELHQNDILLLDNPNNVNNWNYSVEITPSGYGLKVNRASMLDNTVYTANGLVPPSLSNPSNGAFFKDSSYIVSGMYGWPQVPDEVELAAVELMKDYFSKDKVWRNKYIKSIKTFDWSFDYNSDASAGTGNLYADQLLSGYVINQMVII